MLNRAQICFGVLAITAANLAFGGSLTPPAGPVSSTPGPEPRIPINATNTPGDADSIYRISAPGSYYLTGNVTGVNAKRGIEIAASGVSIDLMGYQLIGVAGSLDGIGVSVSNLDTIEVRNGAVRTWGGDGVDLNSSNPHGLRIESVRVTGNSAHGITLGATATVLGCTALDNAYIGISTNGRSVVTDCVASGNGVYGFWLYRSCTATGCTAAGNSSAGFYLDTGCTLTRCTSNDNNSEGIFASNSCTIVECTTTGNEASGITASSGCTINGCTSASNNSDGIRVSSTCLVTGNSSDFNVDGIHATGQRNRIMDNHCGSNALGMDVDDEGNFIARNTCWGSTFANWGVASGNVILVIDAATAGTVTGNAGGVSPGSTNPNANYSY